MVVLFGIGGADDAESPVEKDRDIEGQLAAIQQVVPEHAVGVEALVLAEKAELGQEDVVEHRVEVGARRAGRVVHDQVGHELRLALAAVLEQPEELRGEGVWDDRQPVHLAPVLARLPLELKLGVEQHLAVRRVREVGVGVDLAGHQHRAVHREAAVPADHGLAAHLHRRRADGAEEGTHVPHEERFLTEAERVTAVEEAAIARERDAVRLVLELRVEAEAWRDRPRDEELDLVRRLELGLRLARRFGVLEEAADDTERQAIDERLGRAVLLQAPQQAVGTRRAGDLEAHHVELLAEPVQPRRAGVTGVALQVVLAREGGDSGSGLHLRV